MVKIDTNDVVFIIHVFSLSIMQGIFKLLLILVSQENGGFGVIFDDFSQLNWLRLLN